MIEVAARAKINLALHVTGRRADGYHLLDSLVVFTDIADRITVEAAPALELQITGPFAAQLSSRYNFVLNAARALHPTLGARIALEKNLPASSGIGGGSADAAATLRALSQLWGLPLPPPKAILRLGADVPVCLAGHPTRMQGIGELLTPVTLPATWLVLVNPGVALSTAQVFHGLTCRDNPALPPLPAWPDAASLARWLGATRNDLAAAATRLAPEITATIAALSGQNGCLLARISGSGATCFGLFADEASALQAARMIGQANTGWWVQAGRLVA